MAEDERKSFWNSLPGVLTGLAALITAAGTLIYHNRSRSNPKPAPVRHEGSSQAGSSNTSEEPGSPPEGFKIQRSYGGDCASPAAGSVCVRYRDGFEWLVRDVVAGRQNQVGAWGKHPVLEASGKQGRYQHVLGTDYVKSIGN